MGSHFIGVFTGLVVCSFLTLTELPTSSAERERRQLPCTHPLRISFPKLFAHCNSVCKYSSWSSWQKIPNSVASVPTDLCPSGEAYTEERTRTATGSGCTGSLRETQRICLPTQEERLIIGLGLGGSNNNYQPIKVSNLLPKSFDLLPKIAKPYYVHHDNVPKCPQHGTNGQICHNKPGLGKRSIKYEVPQKYAIHSDESDDTPIPFDWLEHGPRLRNRRQTSCGDQSIQHVLFVLDTSGSIGDDQFDRMKAALAKLPTLFCKQVKFAVITFNQYVNLEFCFNCFENTFSGREEVVNAIINIAYRGGSTHTGHAAKCVCNEILHSSCGISESPECLDVVFVTDGKSNDPKLQICDEIRCLHSHYGIDTYAIGINSGTGYTPSYNKDELDCITNYGDLTSVFEFESFTAFEMAIENIVLRLLYALPESPESCARLDSSISPTGISK